MKTLPAALLSLGLFGTAGVAAQPIAPAFADDGDSHGHNADNGEDGIPNEVQDQGPNFGTGALIDPEETAGGMGPQAAIPPAKQPARKKPSARE